MRNTVRALPAVRAHVCNHPRSPTDIQRGQVVGALSSLKRFGQGPSWSPVVTVSQSASLKDALVQDSTGGSTNPCSTVFSGTGAFSEPESQALRDIIEQHKENTIAYITVHSYGQYWLYPWGYTSDLPDDVAHLDQAARAAVSALTATYGTDYIIGSSTNALYAAAGGSDDWAKGGAGVKYSYTLELRDKGSFILPVSQIEPTLKETWNGLIALCNEILHIEATK
ncbi:hypothetical protein FSP39_007772 [Pinctada imbricata]|uniref:Peptidase M14 domain-containing protein n=1 Tax=Pinctada imbricata TaxID=66713 RepID=A0AA88XQR4_PINIB|nr:hypothetical protein FSP39_007772 [Pinctada imbricata]